MSYIDLKTAKKHLIIEDDFTDDDEYIAMLIEVAEKTVSEEICEDLKDLEDEGGKIPPPLLYAICLQIGDYYAHREMINFGPSMNLIPVYKRLIGLYRNYSK